MTNLLDSAASMEHELEVRANKTVVLWFFFLIKVICHLVFVCLEVLVLYFEPSINIKLGIARTWRGCCGWVGGSVRY